MFHNQEPNQYINRTQKIVLRILKKHHESSFNGILTIRQQFKRSLTKSSEIRARTVESTKEYMFRNFKMCLWTKRMSIAWDSQGQKTFLSSCANNQICIHDTESSYRHFSLSTLRFDTKWAIAGEMVSYIQKFTRKSYSQSTTSSER